MRHIATSTIKSGDIIYPQYSDVFNLNDADRYSIITAVSANASPAASTFTNAEVNLSTDVITITAHGYKTGLPGTLTTAAASVPSPLATGTVYYAVSTGANTFQLASSYANATAGTVINLTGTQSGPHTYTVNTTFAGISAITAASTIVLNTNPHPWNGTSGCRAQLSVTSGYPAGLTSGTNYYIASVSSDRIGLATSVAAATDGTLLALNATTTAAVQTIGLTFTFSDTEVSVANDTLSPTGAASAHGLIVAVCGVLATSGTLPSPWVAASALYPITITTNTFKLSGTSGGAAINVTSRQIDSNHTFTPVAISSASAFLQVSHDNITYADLGTQRFAITGTQYSVLEDTEVSYQYARLFYPTSGGDYALTSTIQLFDSVP